MDVLTPTYRCFRMYDIAVDGRDRFRISASSARDGVTRYCATSPLRQGNAMPARSARSRNDHVVCPVRPTTLCACHSELMMASSLIHSSRCTHRCGYAAIKNSTTANEPVTWLHLCYRLANDSEMPVSMSAASGRTKLRTDVGIIHFVNVEHAARHERDALGTAGFQYIQRAHAVR